MKIFLYCILIINLIQLPILAEEVVTGEWQETNAVQKLFETPLGNLYKITTSPLYSMVAKTQTHSRNCNCTLCLPPKIEGLLQFPLIKNNKINKPIVVVDFKIRVFPALSSKRIPEFSFCLTYSNKNKITADYQDLSGLVMIRSEGLPVLECPSMEWRDHIQAASTYPDFTPDYEPISIRVIFNTLEGTVIFYRNGYQIVSPSLDKRKSSVKIRNLGIIIREDKGKYLPNEYLELSPPLIRQYDKMSDTTDLKPVLFSPYPYQSYASLKKNEAGKWSNLIQSAQRSKNPDFQYAIACKLLYGEPWQCNPDMALKLLQRAAKDDHVLALYELGICYFRGYGVKPDIRAAVRNLDKASELGYQNAEVMKWFVKWHSANRPIYNNEEFIENFTRLCKSYSRQHEHDLTYLSYFIFIDGGIYFPAVTIKLTNLYEFANWYAKPGPTGKPFYFIDYAIESGYSPAGITKVMVDWNLNTNKADKLPEAEVRILLEKALRDNDIRALPLLLSLKARRGDLDSNDFTHLTDLQYSEDALYNLMVFAVKNPNFPGIKEYLTGDYRRAHHLISKSNHPDKYFVLGVKALIPLRYPEKLLKNLSQSAVAAEAYSSLVKAAENGNPVAQYLIARQMYYDDLPKAIPPTAFLNVEKLLISALKGGHIKSSILLAEMELKKNNPAKVILYLKDALKSNYGEAYYLQGQALQAMGNRHKEAYQAYSKAVEYGEIRGLQTLALMISDDKASNKLWADFIRRDLHYRSNDPGDPFYPNVYSEIYRWKRMSYRLNIGSSIDRAK